MSRLWQDLRYAFRVLLKSPAVTSVAVLSLALGIGANTAIFSLVNALILRTLPVPHPQQLVALSTLIADYPNNDEPFSIGMFDEIRKHQQVFSSIFAWFTGGLANFEANGVRFAAALDQVSGDYFRTLEIQPLLGRFISPDDVALGAGTSNSVAVITYRCWQRRYHRDPAIIGKTLHIEGKPFTVIGVTPKSFNGLMIDGGSEVTIPVGIFGMADRRDLRILWLRLAGRLKPGMTLAQARAQITTLWPSVLNATLPPGYEGAKRTRFFARRINVTAAATGDSFLRERFSRPLMLLMGLVGLVLLIACVNLANLMLARAAARRQELGIRVALGASGWRLVRQLLTESILLSLAGAVFGLLVAFAAAHLLVNTMWTGYTPDTLDASPDVRVLAFTAAVAIVTGILFGLAPAMRIARTDAAVALRETSRSVHGGAALSKLLVSSQIALSLVLVVGAMLFTRSLEKLHSANLGYRRSHLLIMQLFPRPGLQKSSYNAAYYHQLADKLAQLPGVEGVSYSNGGPATRYENTQPISNPASSEGMVQAIGEFVGPGFFNLVGMRVLSGREFDWRDAGESTTPVAILSESLAERLFPNQNPIGQKIDFGLWLKGVQIVGIVNSASIWRPQSYRPMAVYRPILQAGDLGYSLADIHTSGDPSALRSAAERTVESLGHHYSLRTQTLEQRADMFLTEERMTAMLSDFFGGLALLLASVGLYGLMSYAITRRTSEIGVRMALGAGTGNVLTLVLREVMWLALAGIAIGVPAALAASRWVSGMLFGLSPTDPAIIASAAAVLLAVATLAGYLPARRASRIDPVTALRAQ